MTDIEKLKAVFTEIGVGFREIPGHGAGEVMLRCQANMPGNTGYRDSIAEFEFLPDGKFKQFGLWED